MINARSIGNNLKETVRGVIEAPSQNLHVGTKKFPEIFSQNIRCLERDLNRVPDESKNLPLLFFSSNNGALKESF
jgi:hypothetical protein